MLATVLGTVLACARIGYRVHGMFSALATVFKALATVLATVFNRKKQSEPVFNRKKQGEPEVLVDRLPLTPVPVSKHHCLPHETGEILPNTPITPPGEMEADTSRTQKLITERKKAMSRMPGL